MRPPAINSSICCDRALSPGNCQLLRIKNPTQHLFKQREQTFTHVVITTTCVSSQFLKVKRNMLQEQGTTSFKGRQKPLLKASATLYTSLSIIKRHYAINAKKYLRNTEKEKHNENLYFTFLFHIPPFWGSPPLPATERRHVSPAPRAAWSAASLGTPRRLWWLARDEEEASHRFPKTDF